jgi:hypothetical protein
MTGIRAGGRLVNLPFGGIDAGFLLAVLVIDGARLSVPTTRRRVSPETRHSLRRIVDQHVARHCAQRQPPARAMTGCGIRVSRVIIRLQSSKSRRCQSLSPACARISFRSWPAQNPRPLAAKLPPNSKFSIPNS